MLKQLTILSLSIFLSSTTISLAQETSTEEPLSSELRAKQLEIENKNKIVSDINKQIYNKSNDVLMREYIRNNNIMNKKMGKETKEIDVKDKAALSQYIQDEIGLQKEIIQVKLPEKETENKRPNTADLLK